jgi:hypothetical protein
MHQMGLLLLLLRVMWIMLCPLSMLRQMKECIG